MQIASGTYTGDAPNTVTVSDCPFPLDAGDAVIIIKGGSNIAAIWIAGMTAGHYKPLTGSTAIQTSGGPTPTSTGFSVTDSVASTNASGTVYRWTAFRDNGGQDFGVFSYANNNTDNRSIPISGLGGNTPDFALLIQSSALVPVTKFKPQSGDASQTTTGQAASDMIQAFEAGGIQVGNSNSVNGNNAATFYGFAIVNSAIFHALAATFAGDGVSGNTEAHGAGFTPNGAWVKATAGETQALTVRHPAHTGQDSSRWSANADGTTGIRALDATTITLGNGVHVNSATGTYAAAVFMNGATDPVTPAGSPHYYYAQLQ